MENGDREGAGLSRSRLGASKNVASFHGGRDRFRLDRSRFLVALGHDRIDYGLMQPHVLKGHHWILD